MRTYLEYFFLVFTMIQSVASLVDSESVWKPTNLTITEEVLANADFEIVTVAQTLCLAIANSQNSPFVACFDEEEGRCYTATQEELLKATAHPVVGFAHVSWNNRIVFMFAEIFYAQVTYLCGVFL